MTPNVSLVLVLILINVPVVLSISTYLVITNVSVNKSGLLMKKESVYVLKIHIWKNSSVIV